MSETPISERALEHLMEFVREVALEANRRQELENQYVTVRDAAARTRQTPQAIYKQIGRRDVNGLEEAEALMRPEGKRSWRLHLGRYLEWLQASPPGSAPDPEREPA